MATMLGCAWRSLHQSRRQLVQGCVRRQRSTFGIGGTYTSVPRAQWCVPAPQRHPGIHTSTRRLFSGHGTQDKNSAPSPSSGSSRGDDDDDTTTDQQALSPEVLLFRARFILPLRVIMRTKHLNIALLVCLCGSGALGYGHGTLTYVAALALSGVTALAARFAARIVLRLSYHPDEQLLRVSTLSYGGRRADYLVAADQVVPYGESQRQHAAALLHKLEVYGSRAPRLYSLRHSDVKDLDALAELLWLPPELGGVRDRTWTRAQTAADGAPPTPPQEQQEQQRRQAHATAGESAEGKK